MKIWAKLMKGDKLLKSIISDSAQHVRITREGDSVKLFGGEHIIDLYAIGLASEKRSYIKNHHIPPVFSIDTKRDDNYYNIENLICQ